MLYRYAFERDELMWYFTAMGAVAGLRAAPLEGGGGQVFDSERSWSLMETKADPRLFANMRRVANVEASLRACTAPTLRDVRALFTPFGAARASWQVQATFSQEGQSLIGLVLGTCELRDSFLAKHRTRITPPASLLLAYLESEVSKLDRTELPKEHRLRRALDAACSKAVMALEEYRIRDRARRQASKVLTADEAFGRL